jgi:alpha-mannosidase
MRGVACLPDIFCSTLDAFAKEVVASGVSLPEHRGESPTIFEGCYTSHADVKHDNRMAENELIAAETLATLAGQDRTEEISETWRTVLFHQFHDIICGSSIKEAYEFTGAELSRATVRARSIADEALKSLQGAVPPGEIGVTNPLGFSRTDVVLVPELSGEGAAVLVDDEGVPVPGQAGPDGLRFLARVPAFATVAYRLAEGTPKAAAISIGDEDARYLTVETAHFFAMVRRDSGIVTTLFDRGADRELVGYNIARAVNCEQVRPDLALGVLQLLEEYPHAMASWVVDEVHTELSLIAGAELRVVECGPVRAVLETRHQIRSSNVVKRVVFYAGLPRIDIELEVQWNEPGGPALGIPGLALAFTTRQQEADAYYETPFAANRRPSDGLVVPALRWADIGGRSYGLAVLNDGKYGFDALGTRVRAHIIRSAYDPDGVSDVGRLDSSRFSLVPHTGHWSEAGIVEHAAGFNNPLRARVSGARESGARESDAARSFDTGWRPHLQEPGTVVIDALKFAHRGDGSRIIRLHESAGRPARTRLTGLPPGSPVFAASVVEDVIRRLEATDGELELVFRPFEVKTLLLAP